MMMNQLQQGFYPYTNVPGMMQAAYLGARYSPWMVNDPQAAAAGFQASLAAAY